jgi:hypothetical protein
MSSSQVDDLRAVIGEYEEERNVTLSRLDAHRQRRTRLEMAREVLIEHGEIAAADRLVGEIDEVDQHIQACHDLLGKLEQLLQAFRSSLAKIETSAQARH